MQPVTCNKLQKMSNTTKIEHKLLSKVEKTTNLF